MNLSDGFTLKYLAIATRENVENKQIPSNFLSYEVLGNKNKQQTSLL